VGFEIIRVKIHRMKRLEEFIAPVTHHNVGYKRWPALRAFSNSYRDIIFNVNRDNATTGFYLICISGCIV
jgi:hypothetical protein